MSHAWNACGFHDPRGFKSHILRHKPVPRGVPAFAFSTRCACYGVGVQKPGKSGRTRRLVDMSANVPEFQYVRPDPAEKVLDTTIVLQPEGTCTLHVVAWSYRGKIVDFAFTQMADEVENPQGGEDHVARYDCCHSEVHKHQYYRNGQHFQTGEKETRTVIAKIESQETSWETIDSEYDHCYNDMTESWDVNYRRWDSDGREQH